MYLIDLVGASFLVAMLSPRWVSVLQGRPAFEPLDETAVLVDQGVEGPANRSAQLYPGFVIGAVQVAILSLGNISPDCIILTVISSPHRCPHSSL